ncbi:MAG: VOC family protein [Actinomycetota bacterium]|nr:VOC family protein [Actinomycetota bacterium]
MKPKLSIVTLGVRDLDRSRAFYGALGWECTGDDEGIAFYDVGGVQLALYPREALAEDVGQASAGDGFTGITLAHNEPSKGDVDRAFAEFLAAGATEIKAPVEVFWGGYSGYIADPDGHLWEIAYNPFTDLT